MTGWVLLAAFLAFAGFALVLYNRMVFLKNQAAKAWYNIDVLLKQRHDEIPKLVAVCEGEADFERSTLERVIAARAAATGAAGMPERVKAEGELSTALGRLLAVAEQYPQLKATQAFEGLRVRVTQLETEIADRREFYNDAATILNTAIESFPTNLLATQAGATPRALYQVAPADTEDVKISFKS